MKYEQTRSEPLQASKRPQWYAPSAAQAGLGWALVHLGKGSMLNCRHGRLMVTVSSDTCASCRQKRKTEGLSWATCSYSIYLCFIIIVIQRTVIQNVIPPKGPYSLDTAHDWVHQPSHSLRPSKFQYSQPFIAIGILVQIMKLTEEHTKVFSSHSRVWLLSYLIFVTDTTDGVCVKKNYPVKIFTDLTRKIGNLLCKFRCKFYSPKILPV